MINQEDKLMKTNLSENCLVSGQYNAQPCLYSEEEIKMIVDNFIVEKLSPDEILKRKMELKELKVIG